MSTTTPVGPAHRKHRYHDAPDTAEAFRKAADMSPGPRRAALREEIIRAWMPMAARLARQFRNRGENMEDLEQVARLGLVKAVARYDPARGTAFESYAVPTIIGEVKRHFRDHMWGLHVPRHVQELRNRVRLAQHELSQKPGGAGQNPGVNELAAQAHLSPGEVRTGLAALHSYSALSLDAEMAESGSGFTLADRLGGPEPAFERVVERESVRDRLRALPERERRILYLRFFRGLTQREIAEELGISQMHVSRLLSRTCERVRREVDAMETAVAGRGR